MAWIELSIWSSVFVLHVGHSCPPAGRSPWLLARQGGAFFGCLATWQRSLERYAQ
jgi:hypothetical protein